MQRTYEFKEDSDKKVKEDVGADVKENYVQYHIQDNNTEVWVIDDFNRVSIEIYPSLFNILLRQIIG